MKKIKEIYIITLILIVIGVTTTFATAGTVNTNGVRMRKDATVEGKILTNLYNGDKVEILEKSGDWYKVKYEGKEGYVHSDFVDSTGKVAETPTNSEDKKQESSKEDTKEVYPKTVKTGATTKVYIVPSMSSTVVTEIKADKNITVNAKLNDWSYISYGDKKGWVRNYILEVKTEKKSEKQNDSKEKKPTITKGYVNVETANMRKEANTSSKIITTLDKNAKVTIISEKTGWYKIEYDSKTGYISKSLISSKASTTSRSGSNRGDEQVTPISQTGYVNATIANIREKATTDSNIITTIKQKAKIEIVGEKNGFYEIKIDDKIGYISKKIVVDSLSKIEKDKDDNKEKTNSTTTKKSESKTEKTKKETTSSNKKDGDDIATFAKKYIGYKYVYGGTTPKGFDCSGFVYYVFNSCGYKISRVCSGQMSTGKAVSKANLKPGDLIFFDNGGGGRIGHVGIYIGGGKIVHAANSSRGVTTDTINSGYYNQYYHSARRVI